MSFFQEVLDRNDLIYNVLPPQWVFGLPIGNGQMAIDGPWLLAPWPHVLFWPGTSAWVAQAFWWHYLYSADEDFLKEKPTPSCGNVCCSTKGS